MRFVLLLLVGLTATSAFAQPAPVYQYYDRYAHPQKSNFSAQFKFGFAALSGSNCTLSDAAAQNYFLNPRASLGIGYQYTHYINILFRAGYFRYGCEEMPATDDNGINGVSFDGFVGIKHYMFPFRDYDNYLRKFNFYGLAGVGAIYVNPRDAVTLQPYADTHNFNQWALMAPLGIGAELKLSDFFLMGLEFNYYFTNADYLDGPPIPSFSGEQGKDNFLSLGVSLSYQIPNKEFIYGNFLRFRNKE